MGPSRARAHESRPECARCYRADRCAGPEWFSRGLKAALLAPTAMNQQRFRFTLPAGRHRSAESRAALQHVTSGIVKYPFKLGAGRETFRWAE